MLETARTVCLWPLVHASSTPHRQTKYAPSFAWAVSLALVRTPLPTQWEIVPLISVDMLGVLRNLTALIGLLFMHLGMENNG